MLRSLGIVAVLVVASIGSAFAQGGAEPSETTETFGSWTVRCRKAADTPKTCELVHSVAGQGGVIAQIAIGTPPGKDKPLFVVQVPLGVLVSQPVTLVDTVDGKAPWSIPFVTCLQIGCIAQLETTAEALDVLAKGQSAKLSFAERTGRAIDIAVPLNGMQDALARLRAD